MFETIVFDCDDTLYASSCGLMQAVAVRMNEYMMRITGLPPAETERRRAAYLHNYGTTLAGLEREFDVDPEDYLAFVHNIPYERFLAPDEALNALLSRLPQRKVLFTNGTREHATAVLGVLGIGHHFDALLDLRDFGMRPKPNPEAYACLREALTHDPSKALLLDDRPGNLIPAREMGMTTVLVNETATPVQSIANYQVRRVHDVAQILGTD